MNFKLPALALLVAFAAGCGGAPVANAPSRAVGALAAKHNVTPANPTEAALIKQIRAKMADKSPEVHAIDAGIPMSGPGVFTAEVHGRQTGAAGTTYFLYDVAGTYDIDSHKMLTFKVTGSHEEPKPQD